MDKIQTIFKKELKGILFSSNFLIVCGLCATILSWVYPFQLNEFAANLQNHVFQMQVPKQQLNIHYAVFLRNLSFLNILLIIIVPALTMRLFAEEKKMRTFDLLLTSPITSVQIVVGKYLAVLGAILALMLIAFLYPAATSLFVKVQWLNLIIAFAAIFLVGAMYAAMNMFSSSLTESAVISYVMSVLLNFSVWFIGMAVDSVDSPIGRKIFEQISLNQHLTSLVEGTIKTSSLIYFASVIFLFVFLAERVVESSRWRS